MSQSKASPTPKFISLGWGEWVDQFQPIENHLDDNASFDGFMYDIDGAEDEYVRELVRSPNPADGLRVWTICDCDGETVVTNGYHFVNRLGYIVTKMPAPEGFDIEVIDEDVPRSDLEDDLEDELHGGLDRGLAAVARPLRP